MRPDAGGAIRNHLARSEFVAAWKCENELCDYFEEWNPDAMGD
jgi:hypothetical protein